VALKKSDTFLALQSDATNTLAIIRENLGNDRITDRDLDRITVPLGGGVTWTVPTLEGEETVRTLDGIIVHWTKPRAYWSTGMEVGGGNTPPDCSSNDGVTGYGEPGGDCETCHLNLFPARGAGGGKPCKEKRMLFMLQSSDLLPIVIQAPSTSIQPIRQYFRRLASNNAPYWSVVTSLSLEKAQSGSGFTFSRIAPKSKGPVPEDQRGTLAEYIKAIRPLIGHMVELEREREV